MRLVPCTFSPHRIRVAIDPGDTRPEAVMAYAETQGAVVVRDGKKVYLLRGRHGEPADIDATTLVAYLDPHGTCQRNNALAAAESG